MINERDRDPPCTRGSKKWIMTVIAISTCLDFWEKDSPPTVSSPQLFRYAQPHAGRTELCVCGGCEASGGAI